MPRPAIWGLAHSLKRNEIFVNKYQLAFVLLLIASLLNSQTQVDVRTQTKNVDFSGASSTIPAKSGTSLPATCKVGELFFETSNSPGQNLFTCAPVNTWTLVSGTGTTSTTGAVLSGTTGQFGLYLSNGTTIGGHTLTASDIPALSYQAPLAFTGSGAKTASSTGTTAANDCAKWDANGNVIDAGAPCGSGSGAGISAPSSTVIGAVPQYGNTTGTSLSSGLGLVTTVGTPGSDSNLATEKSIRTALSAATSTFGGLTGGTNTTANMVVGSGGALSATGTGTIAATSAPASGVTGLAASATTDTTNASNITSGTLGAARMPNPSATTLGGVQSAAAVAHQFVSGISTSGVPTQAQPAAADINGLAPSATTDTTNASNISSGTLAAARLPIVPVANGGTGTATPSLVAGGNVTVTGTWPNQTIAATGGSSGSGTTFSVTQSSNHVAAGDSITYGVGATQNSSGYAYLLAKDENAVITNRGVAGQLACDLADTQSVKSDLSTLERSPIYTMMIGTNDAQTKGVGAYEAVYQNCHKAALAWLAVPSVNKVAAGACTQTGTWASDSRYALPGATSTTNASTLSCTIPTSGGPLYAWYQEADSNGGTFTYAVDGGATTSVTTATTPAIATQNGGTRGVGLIRITGLTAGSHTILFTVTSATNASNSVGITAIGTLGASTYGGPKVFSAGVTRQQGDANSAATAQYNTDAQSDVTTLAGDGLAITFVPVRNYLCTAVVSAVCYNKAGIADMSDIYHPNQTGHSDVKEAFETTEQFTLPTLPQQLTTYGNSSTDAASLGAELTSAGNATSTGWTGSYDSYTNGSSNASPLSFAIGAVTTNYYQTTVTISGLSAGTLTVTIGGAAVGTYSSNGTYTTWAQSTGTGAFSLTPSAAFNGTVGVSAKLITPVTTYTLNGADSTGASSLVALTPKASFADVFIGGGGTLNITGTQNSAMGYNSLFWNISGAANSAFGWKSMFNNTSANNNSAYGFQSLTTNTTGSNNTAIGMNAMYANTSGGNNAAFGYAALQSNTTGQFNTAIGSQALLNTTSGGSNTALGYNAMQSNTTGASNLAIGSAALQNNTSGSGLVAVGNSAMQSNTTGTQNTAVGSPALQANTTGSNNTAVGFNALQSANTATGNSAFGQQALDNVNSGSQNAAGGLQALFATTTGQNNAAWGFQGMYSNTTGSTNSALGYRAGFTVNGSNANTTGSNNTYLGEESGAANSTQYNFQTVIGAQATCAASNAICFGRTSDTVQVNSGMTQNMTIYSATGTALPTCGASAKGLQATVSDAASPTYLGTYTSGGSTLTPVICNGAAWVTY
jgi:hypothetical protein